MTRKELYARLNKAGHRHQVARALLECPMSEVGDWELALAEIRKVDVPMLETIFAALDDRGRPICRPAKRRYRLVIEWLHLKHNNVMEKCLLNHVRRNVTRGVKLLVKELRKVSA